jgi:hypothetical protein
MNERIKELAEQAGLIQWEISPWNPFVKIPDHESVVKAKKFAELIVRECMGVARGMRNPSNLNYKPSDRFVDELRLHFGIEE